MAVNKVIFGNVTLIDTSEMTVQPGTLFQGETALGSDGEIKTGTFTIADEITQQDGLISQIKTALKGKAAGGGGSAAPVIEALTVTENGIYNALNGVDGYSPVTVAVPIPDPAKPEQTKSISVTENGSYEILPDAGYTLSGVQVNVEVEEIDDFAANYQRVEYIESAEEETYPYIITDFIVDNTCGAEVIASFPKMQDRIPMGSREDSGTTRFYVVYPLSTSSIYYGFGTGSTVSCSLKVNTIYRLQTNFLNSRLVCVYEENGTRKANASINATLTPHSVPLAIFGYNSASSGVVTSKREYKFYGARCSRNNEVVREYIPCYRKSDNVVGLYEKFTKQFLTNAGAGSFDKGPDVTA